MHTRRLPPQAKQGILVNVNSPNISHPNVGLRLVAIPLPACGDWGVG